MTPRQIPVSAPCAFSPFTAKLQGMGVRLRKILLAGGPSSGKTTLANEVNVLLKLAGKRSEIVPEYARAYIAQCGLPKHAYEQLMILEGQRRAEAALAEHADYLVIDSSTWFCYVYARQLLPADGDPVERAKYEHVMHEIWRKSQEDLAGYTDTFFLPSHIAVQDDGLRHDAEFARTMEVRLRAFLDSEGVAYRIVSGPLKKRAEIVLAALGVPTPRVVRARARERTTGNVREPRPDAGARGS